MCVHKSVTAILQSAGVACRQKQQRAMSPHACVRVYLTNRWALTVVAREPLRRRARSAGHPRLKRSAAYQRFCPGRLLATRAVTPSVLRPVSRTGSTLTSRHSRSQILAGDDITKLSSEFDSVVGISFYYDHLYWICCFMTHLSSNATLALPSCVRGRVPVCKQPVLNPMDSGHKAHSIPFHPTVTQVGNWQPIGGGS